MKLILPLIYLFSTILLNVANCSKILVLTPMGSKSHKQFFGSTAEALAKRGHDVTIVSIYKNSKEIPNLRDVVLPGPNIEQLMGDVFTKGPDSVMQNLFMESPRMCSESLSYARDIGLHKEKYDLVIISMFMNFCYLSLIHQLKVPYIYGSPAGLLGPFNRMVGNIQFPSVVPNILLNCVYPLTFMERLQSVLMDEAFSLAMLQYTEPLMEKHCRERGFCPPDMPSFSEFHDNVSLAIINDVRMLEVPARPMMPNVIYAGCLHCHPSNPLPKVLEDFVQSSGDDGFIFFSMGSAVKPSTLPEKYRKILINAFAVVDQKVLFKWDEPTMADLPPNVMLGKWLPQQDLLAHPKMKLFITHGGLNSALEATYHGTPLLGIPIFADQHSNMKTAEKQGWARTITWEDLDEVKLVKMIREVIQNSKMKESIAKRAALMKDVRNLPKDDIIYWVEYVLRHKGAEHLWSPVRKMSWIKLYNADVYVALFIVLVAILSILMLIPYLLLKCFCGSKPAVKKTNKKKKNQ